MIHFIDNTGALVGLSKGYSRDVDTARIAHVFHTACAACGTSVWFEYVASGANIADLQSREDFAMLDEFGSEPFDIECWPNLDRPWRVSYSPLPRCSTRCGGRSHGRHGQLAIRW